MQGNFQPQNLSHQDSYPNQQNNYQQQQQQQQSQQQQQYGNSQAMQTQQSTGQTRLIPQGIPVYNQQPTYNQAPVYGQPIYDLQDPMRDSIENQEIIVDVVGQPLKGQEGLQLKDYSEIPTSRFSQKLHCQNCKQISSSQIKFEPGPGTWCIAVGLFVCIVWPCCFIPFFNSECKDVHHYCSKCSAQMGVKKFLFN